MTQQRSGAKGRRKAAAYKCCPMCEAFGAGPCEECDRLNVQKHKPRRKPLKLWADLERLKFDTMAWHDYCVPVAVFSLSPEAHEARLGAVTKALCKLSGLGYIPAVRKEHENQARAVLKLLTLAPKGARKQGR